MTKHRRRKGATTKQRNKCFMFYVINLCSKDAALVVIITKNARHKSRGYAKRSIYRFMYESFKFKFFVTW